LNELQFQIDQWDQDSSHVAMMMRGDSDPASLSAVEWAQYARRWANRHSVWAMAHTGLLESTLQRSEWEGWDRSYSDGACLPGRRQFWAKRRAWYGGEFQAHVDSVLAQCQWRVKRRGRPSNKDLLLSAGALRAARCARWRTHSCGSRIANR
jgi:hypothetical protein